VRKVGSDMLAAALFCASLLLLGFAFGFTVAKRKVFPYATLVEAVDYARVVRGRLAGEKSRLYIPTSESLTFPVCGRASLPSRTNATLVHPPHNQLDVLSVNLDIHRNNLVKLYTTSATSLKSLAPLSSPPLVQLSIRDPLYEYCVCPL
jgi:hypothetical protein